MLLLTSKRFSPPNRPMWPFRINPESPQAVDLEVWVPLAISGRGIILPCNRLAGGAAIVRNDAVGGPGCDFNTTDNNRVSFVYPDAPFLSNRGVTVVWMGVLDRVSSVNTLIYKTTAASANNNPFEFRTGGIDAAGFALGRGSATGNNQYSSPGSILSTATYYQLVATVPDNLIQTPPSFYVNGAFISTPSAGGATGAVTGTESNIFSGGVLGSFSSDIYTSEIRVYRRGISASIIFDMWNPETRYDLYWTPSNVSYFTLTGPPTVGGGSAFPALTVAI